MSLLETKSIKMCWLNIVTKHTVSTKKYSSNNLAIYIYDSQDLANGNNFCSICRQRTDSNPSPSPSLPSLSATNPSPATYPREVIWTPNDRILVKVYNSLGRKFSWLFGWGVRRGVVRGCRAGPAKVLWYIFFDLRVIQRKIIHWTRRIIYSPWSIIHQLNNKKTLKFYPPIYSAMFL